MNERSRRKELTAQYKQTRPEAAVYRLVNRRTGKALLGSTTNLASLRAKLAFARETNTPSALDGRLRAEIERDGLDAFALEVLEVLAVKPEATAAQVRDDLAALEALWREQQDPALLY